jgi:ubiquinone/menaquinone biosynthesis C-methylase UbiE
VARESIFDLETRVKPFDPFDTVEKCRQYDLESRTAMIIPTQHLIGLLTPHFRPGAKILEVGCGAGLVSLRLAARHPEVEFYGIETNDSFLKVMQENLVMANLLSFKGKFSYEWGRYSRLPVADASVDVVFSFSSLHRWPDPLLGIKECARVCKPGGLVLLYDLARDADEGMILFVLQYTGTGHEEFMGAMQCSFTVSEMQALLKDAGLPGWQVALEGISLIVSSKPIETSYSVGAQSIYENIFA